MKIITCCGFAAIMANPHSQADDQPLRVAILERPWSLILKMLQYKRDDSKWWFRRD
jgi:hypothetical protein